MPEQGASGLLLAVWWEALFIPSLLTCVYAAVAGFEDGDWTDLASDGLKMVFLTRLDWVEGGGCELCVREKWKRDGR